MWILIFTQCYVAFYNIQQLWHHSSLTFDSFCVLFSHESHIFQLILNTKKFWNVHMILFSHSHVIYFNQHGYSCLLHKYSNEYIYYYYLDNVSISVVSADADSKFPQNLPGIFLNSFICCFGLVFLLDF